MNTDTVSSDAPEEQPVSDCFGDFRCHVSVSPMQWFKKCPFRWYAHKVQHQLDPGKPTRGLQIGKACHAEVEGAVNGKVAPEELSALARLSYDLIPSVSDWVPEFVLDHVDLGLVWPFYGKIDLLRYRGGQLAFIDSKFASEGKPPFPGGYRLLPKTKEAIQNDFQLCLYAAALQRIFGDLPATQGQNQVNYNTGERCVVEAPCSQEAVSAAVEEAKNLCESMDRMSRAPAWDVPTEGLPGQGPHCNAYGRPCETLRYCREIEQSQLGGRSRTRPKTGWEI